MEYQEVGIIKNYNYEIESILICTYLLSIVGIFSPIVPLMLTVGFLIATDFVMAIYKAWKKKEKITSRKMYNTVPKIFIYNLMIISVFLLEKYIIQSGVPIEKVAASAIALNGG
jgi:hypothetical protein